MQTRQSQSRADGLVGEWMFRNVTPSQPQSGSWSHRAQWLQCLMWAYEGVGDYPGLWDGICVRVS